jgi:CTP:molybdopterin cytidylyltransferase MocA
MPGIAAVVLAGDGKGSKAIKHDNKAFLEFRGEPVIIHVFRALQAAERVGCIVVVGPAGRLQTIIDASNLPDRDRIIVVEQRQNVLENGKAGFVASLGIVYSPSLFHSLRQSEHADTAALALTCDIPLVTPWEIDEMISASNMRKYDYCIGATKDDVMEPYYPSGDEPGIRMAYFHLNEGRCRPNNLHMVKPLKIHRMVFVEQMYLARYQKKFTNMFRLIMVFLFVGRWMFRATRLYFSLQFARSRYNRLKGGRLYERVRKTNRLSSYTRCAGGVMDMKMGCTFTSYGGATLDADNAKDLEVAERMRDRWMTHQEEIYHRMRKAE